MPRSASIQTEQFYKHGSAAILAAAANWHGLDIDAASSEQKLIGLHCYLAAKDKEYLAPGSICVYRQLVRTAIAGLVDQGIDPARAEDVRVTLVKGLADRKNIPRIKRGAAHKIIPEKEELREVFGYLKEKFLSGLDVLDLVLALYLVIAPRIGVRPIELTSAERRGRNIVVRTAKVEGRPFRTVPLSEDWPDDYLAAIDVLFALVPNDLDPVQFKLWRNALASRMARASRRSSWKRRISLYFARHVSFASWREIGMSAEEIARLAGHIKLESQRVYGRGSAGFGAEFMFEKARVPETMIGTFDNVEQTTGTPVGASKEPDKAPGADTPAPLTLHVQTAASQAVERKEPVAKVEFDPFPPRPKPSTKKGEQPDLSSFQLQADAIEQAASRFLKRRHEGALSDQDTGSPDPGHKTKIP